MIAFGSRHFLAICIGHNLRDVSENFANWNVKVGNVKTS